ncbi:MAG: sodium:calcium antiporter, partial [Desulfobacterales bacterium]|nr:sodium:calcium antiporter [Desulfobacterales bacterium]
AFGTSLPELSVSVVAAMRKEMDISLGNLLGSNIFNILGVLGTASLVRPILIPGGFIQSGLLIDYLVMMFIGFLPWLMMRKKYMLTKKDGVILLSGYVGYIAYLTVKAL